MTRLPDSLAPMLDTSVSRWCIALAAVALAVTAGLRSGRTTTASSVQPPVKDQPVRDARCLDPRPPSGVYDSADGSLRVAIVDGCVALSWRPSYPKLAPSSPATLLAPHFSLGGWEPTTPGEVVMVPAVHRIATAGDGIVLSAGSEGAPSVFTRNAWREHRGLGPAVTDWKALRLRVRIDTRDLVALLATGDAVVQTAALTRLVSRPLDARTCAAVRAWIDRTTPETERIATSVLGIVANTEDRCLITETRRALERPHAAQLASTAFTRIATLEERIEALLAVVDAPAYPGSHQVAEELAEYLHPDHCGPQDRTRCLTAARGAELEAALRARIGRDPTTTPAPLHALRAYLGAARHAAYALNVAANAPCRAIESLVSHAYRLPVEQIAPAFARVLARRECARGREVAASVLGHLLTNNTVPEAAWKVFGRYLDTIPPRRRPVFWDSECYPATRDRHAAADAVLALTGFARCAPAGPAN